MKTTSATSIISSDGVEVWRLMTDGVEQFAVRVGERRARVLGSLEAARALFDQHVLRARLARAH